jgi:hypothetical protein
MLCFLCRRQCSVIRIRMIRMFLGLPDSHPDPLVTSTDPAPILPSSSKNSEENLDLYCFVNSSWLFIFEEWCKCTSVPNPHPDPQDPYVFLASLIRIRIRQSEVRIRGSGSASGSVPNCRGSPTLVGDNYNFLTMRWYFLGTFFKKGQAEVPFTIFGAFAFTGNCLRDFLHYSRGDSVSSIPYIPGLIRHPESIVLWIRQDLGELKYYQNMKQWRNLKFWIPRYLYLVDLCGIFSFYLKKDQYLENHFLFLPENTCS